MQPTEQPQHARIFYTDRTRIVQYRRCPRARFYSTELELSLEEGEDLMISGGVTPKRLSLPLVIGSAVHEGLEVLHRAAITQPYSEIDLDPALAAALEYFDNETAQHMQDLDAAPEDAAQDEFAFLSAPGGFNEGRAKLEFKLKEARALVEGLVTAYMYVGLPQLLDTYEILSVEEEMCMPLAENGKEFLVNLLGRADAIMRHKATNTLVALSIKTAKDLDARANKNWMMDDQGISEMLLLRHLVESGQLEQYGYNSFDNVQFGLQMLFLLKGKEYKDDRDGLYKHSNPLVKFYIMEHPSGEIDYAPKYEYVDDLGAKRRLGKGWRSTQIWEHPPATTQPAWLEFWIQLMQQNHPGVVEGLVLLPEFYLRTQMELDHWMYQAAQQEANIAAAKIDAENPNINLPALLNSEFPLHRHSCNYPSACDYQGLCHPVANELGMSQLGEQLLQATSLVQLHGLGFKLRTPNHPEPSESRPSA